MALHRKFDAMLRLRPDIAVISECAGPKRLQELAGSIGVGADTVWIGDNRNKGLAVFAFNGYAVRLAEPFHATLRHVAPVRVSGPVACNLLAVWAQNGSGGVNRKHQLGPLRRALTKYKAFLAEQPAIVAGDFNNNVFWHRPGWRINHANAVASLQKLGLASAYHVLRGELQGEETVPTLYWRDRKKDGPGTTSTTFFCQRPGSARYAIWPSGRSRTGAARDSAITCRWWSTSAFSGGGVDPSVPPPSA